MNKGIFQIENVNLDALDPELAVEKFCQLLADVAFQSFGCSIPCRDSLRAVKVSPVNSLR